MKKVLLHICCAPCAVIPVDKLRSENFEVIGFFYNPNIHPYQEYLRRKEAVEILSKAINLNVIFDEEYDFKEFLRSVASIVEKRCGICYEKRLRTTAQKAGLIGCDAFTSTLLISPHQNHEMIKTIGEECAKSNGVELLYRDYRSDFKSAYALSQKYGLYRQQYCGCIYSEYERYSRSGKNK